VIDPDVERRKSSASILKKNKYNVVHYDSALEAVKSLSDDSNESPLIDAILIVHAPPKLDAAKQLEYLRTYFELQSTSTFVLFVKDCMDQASLGKCLALGADDFWTMPLDNGVVGKIFNHVWQHRMKISSESINDVQKKSGSGSGDVHTNFAPSQNLAASMAAHHHHRKHHKRQNHHHDQAQKFPTESSQIGLKEGSDPSVKSEQMGKADSAAEVAEVLAALRENTSKPRGSSGGSGIKSTDFNSLTGNGSNEFMAWHPWLPSPVMYRMPDDDGNLGWPPSHMDSKAQQDSWMKYQQQCQEMQMRYAAMQAAIAQRQGKSQLAWPMYPFIQAWNPMVWDNAVSSKGSDFTQYVEKQRAMSYRSEAVKKYRAKKEAKSFGASKKIRYQKRQDLAQSRPRIRGQFVPLEKIQQSKVASTTPRSKKNGKYSVGEEKNADDESQMNEMSRKLDAANDEGNKTRYGVSRRCHPANGEWQSSSSGTKDLQSGIDEIKEKDAFEKTSSGNETPSDPESSKQAKPDSVPKSITGSNFATESFTTKKKE
jgi:CheY-like chemotaxis protein